VLHELAPPVHHADVVAATLEQKVAAALELEVVHVVHQQDDKV
jgi:hypothetical protein